MLGCQFWSAPKAPKAADQRQHTKHCFQYKIDLAVPTSQKKAKILCLVTNLSFLKKNQ